jgi:hypothetical protein
VAYPSICEYQGIDNVLNSPILALSPSKSSKIKDQLKNPCKEGFTYWLGECYWIVTENKNFFEADQECRKQGSYLASIHSNQQNRWLIEFLANADFTSEHIWIGMHDISKEGEMRWLDKSPVNYRYFIPGDPNNHGGYENCVGYFNGHKGWADFECTSKFKAICQWSPSTGK